MKLSFSDLYSFNKPFEEDFLTDVREIFRDSSFVGGKFIEKFERTFSETTRNKYCVSTSSGTDSLSVILRSLEIHPEKGVIYYPANTFIGSILGALQLGYKCKPYDVSLKTFNADEETFSSIGDDASVVIAVHLYGYGLKHIEKLKEICEKKNAVLLEDCSQAHFQEIKDKQVSNFGKASFYSMYPGKNFGAAGQAGAVCTDDEDLVVRMKAVRNYGAPKKYEHTFKGFNYRMDSIQAAFLCRKFPVMVEEIEKRREIATSLLSGIVNPQVSLMQISPEESVWHLFPVYTEKRDQLIRHLDDKKIETVIHYPKNCHHFSCWSNQILAGSTSNADTLSSGILSLPCHGAMSKDQVNYLIEAINEFGK